MDRPRLARTILKLLAILALLLLALQLAYSVAVRRYFDGLTVSLAPVADLRYGGIVAFPPGQLGLRDVRFSVAGLPALALQVDRVTLRSRDPAWLLGWLAGRQPGLGKDLAIRLEGVRPSAALLLRLRQRSGSVGVTLPFEGVGCGDTGAGLAPSDYAALGWDQVRWDLDLRMGYQSGSRRLDMDWRLDRLPPMVLNGQAVFMDVSPAGGLLSADLGGARLDRLALRYNERGLLQQRNDYCRNGQGGDRFVERHRQQLNAWFASVGMVPDEPVWNAYGQWLDQGGELEVLARPAQAVRFDEYSRFAPADRLRLLGLSLRTGDSGLVPVEAVASGVLIAADFSPLPDLPDDEPWPEETDDWGDLDASDDGLLSLPPEPGEPDPVDAASVPRAPTRPRLSFREIAFFDLADRRGERVRITTLGGNRHSGIVLDATADALELQISRYGGGARLPIARENIQRIELVRIE